MAKCTQRRHVTAFAGLVAASALALTGCGDSAGPEAGEVTTERLQRLEGQLGGFEERLGMLEQRAGDQNVEPEIIGEQVTVSAQVSEVVTSSGVGSAFRIGGDEGPAIPVLTTSPPEGLDDNDVVRVTGTLVEVARESFEEDFGVAADELFDDPDAFFEESEDQPAIAATEIEVLQEQAD